MRGQLLREMLLWTLIAFLASALSEVQANADHTISALLCYKGAYRRALVGFSGSKLVLVNDQKFMWP